MQEPGPPAGTNLKPEGHLRLHYLDGVRGLAAFHVLLVHAFGNISGVAGWLPQAWCDATQWASNGRVSVQIFIALSGYCLMLPVARSGRLQGGVWAFAKRRARRILPPYYVALALTLALILLVPGLNHPTGLQWDQCLPAFSPAVLISHLLLLQDLSNDWILKIQGPMWTIAQEWQIYFVFALVLLPLWRRFGILTALGFSFVASLLLRHVFGYDLTFAAPQFLFLFAAGMFAATVSFPGSVAWLQQLRDRMPWTWPMAILWALYLVLWLRYPDNRHLHSSPYSVLVSAAIFCTLVYCTRSVQTSDLRNRVLKFFELQPLVILGTFGYSLYLVHSPILGLCTLALHHWAVPAVPALLLQLFVSVPLATLGAYVFHLLAERPFMRGHPASLPRAEKAAVLDTAP